LQIEADIDNDAFQDNQRMERFEVIFANRYLNAYDRYSLGIEVTRS